MLGDIWYDDSSILPTMPPSIKLSDQYSLGPSNFKGKITNLFAQMSRHHTV